MQLITLAVLMDDIASINRKKDSSFAMMLEAQSRDWEIYTFDSVDMFHLKDKYSLLFEKLLLPTRRVIGIHVKNKSYSRFRMLMLFLCAKILRLIWTIFMPPIC